MKQVVHIFGASGSGTSTLAKALCERTGFTHIESDDCLWLPTDPPFTTKRSPEERLAVMRRAIADAQSIVIAGSLVGWGDPLIPLFTLAVRLSAPTAVRLDRVKARELKRFGARILPGGDMYEEQLAFYRWAEGYDDGGIEMRSKAMHDAWQRRLLCPRLDLDGTLPVEMLADAVLKAMEPITETERSDVRTI